jgi:hypothetical protein
MNTKCVKSRLLSEKKYNKTQQNIIVKTSGYEQQKTYLAIKTDSFFFRLGDFTKHEQLHEEVIVYLFFKHMIF